MERSSEKGSQVPCPFSDPPGGMEPRANCAQGTAAFCLNGKLSAAFCDQAAGSTFQAGSIGLQIPDAGTRIEFKDIQLRLITERKKVKN